MTIPSFSFVKLVVADLDRAETFYSAVFAMEVKHRHNSDEHDFGQKEAVLGPSGASGSLPLILTTYLRRPCPLAGSAWTGFVVDDIEATVLALERAGGRVEVPIHRSHSPTVKAAVASDPDGHMIEIIQMIG